MTVLTWEKLDNILQSVLLNDITTVKLQQFRMFRQYFSHTVWRPNLDSLQPLHHHLSVRNMRHHQKWKRKQYVQGEPLHWRLCSENMPGRLRLLELISWYMCEEEHLWPGLSGIGGKSILRRRCYCKRRVLLLYLQKRETNMFR